MSPDWFQGCRNLSSPGKKTGTILRQIWERDDRGTNYVENSEKWGGMGSKSSNKKKTLDQVCSEGKRGQQGEGNEEQDRRNR